MDSESIIDTSVWVLGGALLGLLGLVLFNFYMIYTKPPVPKVKFKIPKIDSSTEKNKEVFQPIGEFYLVKKPSKPEEEKENKNKDEQKNETEKKVTKKENIPITNLPIQLQGTLTGYEKMSRAIIQHVQLRETRSLKPGDSWEQFEVREIHENEIVLYNKNKQRLERATLTEKN